VETKPGRYYVDEIAADTFVRVRRAKALGMLAIVVGLCGLAMLASRFL
jgi:hypothetical protein